MGTRYLRKLKDWHSGHINGYWTPRMRRKSGLNRRRALRERYKLRGKRRNTSYRFKRNR